MQTAEVQLFNYYYYFKIKTETEEYKKIVITSYVHILLLIKYRKVMAAFIILQTVFHY